MAFPPGRSGGEAWPQPALNWAGCWLLRRVIFEVSFFLALG